MRTLHRLTCTWIGLGTVVLAAGCAKTDNNAASDTSAMAPAAAAGSTATAPAGAPPASQQISLSEVAGKWTTRAVPDSGKDTSATTSTMVATATPAGWTLTFPGRPALPLRVSASGDSIITDAGPYESVRRKGVQVTIHDVMRMRGDSLIGYTISHYKTSGADSVMTFHTTSTRAK